MDQIWNVLWILFLVSAFMPWIQTRVLESARLRALRRLALTEGRWTHDYPITLPQAQRPGLPAGRSFPAEVYALMELYPQPHQARPSVQFVPAPYGRKSASWAPRSGR
jgi:hypothetical protein